MKEENKSKLKIDSFFLTLSSTKKVKYQEILSLK